MLEQLLNKWVQAHLNNLPAQVTTGIVEDINEDVYTCTIKRDDRPELFNVRLNACEYEGNRFVIVPSADSVVLVCMIESDPAEAMIIACSEIDKVLVVIDDASFEVNSSQISAKLTGAELKVETGKITASVSPMSLIISAAGVSMNGGSLGGLPKISKVKDGMNSIKGYAEAMKSAVATAFQQIPNGGAVAAMNFNSSMSSQSITIPTDMENTNVKQ